MKNDLKKVFLNHKGKISDKWELYINEWDQIFYQYQDKDINLFEIGVHNGGSLEIWAEYFKNARQIVGCDINKDCRKLEFEDPRVSIIIGEINSDSVKAALKALANNFDIVIDDGSHSSGDIIRAFSHYFNFVNPGGIYVIEDLHASYWDEFEGGLHYPFSAISFLKRLVDIPNYEHWRNNQSRDDFLASFAKNYNLNFENFQFNAIHKIEFLNSLCIIHKRYPKENKLGNRMVVGDIETVSEDWKRFDGTTIHQMSAHVQDFSKFDIFSLINTNGKLIADAKNLKNTLLKINSDFDEQSQKIHELRQIITDREDHIGSLQSDLNSLEQTQQGLLIDLSSREQIIGKLEVMIADLRQAFEHLKKEISSRDKQIEELKGIRNRQNQAVERYDQELKLKEQQIESYNLNLENFEKIVHNQSRQIAELEEEVLSYSLRENWQIKNIFRKLSKLVGSKHLIKNFYYYFRIRRSGLFDEHYYLQKYPDIRKAKIDPLMHYIQHGWKEARNPNDRFDTRAYLAFNPDIERTGINPLVHFITHSVSETHALNRFNFKNNQFSYIDLSTHEGRLVAIPFNANAPAQSQDILIFPIIEWDFRFQRPQQIARQLAEAGHRVFYIKSTFRNMSAPLIQSIDRNIYSVQLSSGEPSTGIYSSFSDKNIKALESSIHQLKDHFLINAAIMMVDLPTWWKLAARLKDSFGWKLVYDCMDLHIGFSNSSAMTQRDEKLLLKNSDLVLASSHRLYEHAKTENEHTILIPNGTDFSLFHLAKEQIAVKEIKDIKDISKPIIGYYGAIADWFDTHLVGDLASSHPEWTFLLIGSTDLADLEPLKGLPNVHLFGEKPYAELPAYLSNFDVCIIPFIKNPLTQATNPVKLFEYLSAGRPIVATRLDEISRYEEFVRLAQTSDEWENAIEESIAEVGSTELLNKRFNFARENSWEKRTRRINAAFAKLFPKISIIVLTYDNLNLTKGCLESIIKNTALPDYELIIVDNGSKKDTVDYLKTFASETPNVVLQLNEKNLGFAAANNQGFRISKGDYILFLNNDTIVTAGWLHRLWHHLSKDHNVGMVGPVTNSIGNEAKIEVSYTNLDDINTFGAQRAKDFSGKAFSIKVLALYCCMISRDLFDEIGGLDERYEVAMFEDDDLAMKVREKGLNLLCAEDVFIHHFHGASLKKLSGEDYQKLFEENKQKFEEKWGIEWQPHQYRGKS
jgi:GT2 family glycosyltransferase/glycosyltransferase involved in cell wall biosynthesis